MKIKNKLIIVNLSVLTLFLATFFLFYLSTDKLMKIKDLQKDMMQLRSYILSLEYANEAVLKSEEIPLYKLEKAYRNLDEFLNALREYENLTILDSETVERVSRNYRAMKQMDFHQYDLQLIQEISILRPKIFGFSIETAYLNVKYSAAQDKNLYDRIQSIRRKVLAFSDWYHPFSVIFNEITEEILDNVKTQLISILIRTGAGLMISLFLSLLVIIVSYRGMIQKISLVRDGIEKISGGNLKTRIQVDWKDELASMSESFNTLTETVWQRLNTIGSIIENIGQTLNQEPDTHQLEKTILRLAIENTHAENGAFYKAVSDKKILIQAHATNLYAHPYESSKYEEDIPFGKTIIGMAAVSGEPFFVGETGVHNLIPNRTIFDRHYISSCMVLPLISEREVVGVICLEKNREMSHFRDMDFSNILSFIEFSAVTLRNMEKYAELLHSTGLNREMQIATDIQKSLLPPKIPRLPHFDITVHTYSVKGMSGDIYDFFPVNHEKWLFCMAEVMEKGIASSMLLVILRTLVRILVQVDQDPAELMTILLQNFAETTGITTKVHVNICLMEPDKKLFTYCGTTGQSLMIYHSEKKVTGILKSKFNKEGHYESVKAPLSYGDYLVLMTEGFLNTRNAEGESYGWNPVMKILKKYNKQDSNWLLDAILKDVSYFEGETEQSHDRSIFLAGFKEKNK